jgi:hypothetical protein
MAWLGYLLRASRGWSQGIAWAELSSGSSREKVVGRIQFLMAWWLRKSCWLLVGAMHSSQRPLSSPFCMATSIFINGMFNLSCCDPWFPLFQGFVWLGLDPPHKLPNLRLIVPCNITYSWSKSIRFTVLGIIKDMWMVRMGKRKNILGNILDLTTVLQFEITIGLFMALRRQERSWDCQSFHSGSGKNKQKADLKELWKTPPFPKHCFMMTSHQSFLLTAKIIIASTS